MAAALSTPRSRAFALTLPVIAFLAFSFIAPVGTMLWHSIYEPEVADALPETLAALETWDGRSLPSEAVYRTAAREFEKLRSERALGGIATRVNRVYVGARSTIVRTARRLQGATPSSWREAMAEADADWRDIAIWGAIQRAGERYTLRHYLHAVDLDYDPAGNVVPLEPERAIHLPLLANTLLASAGITLLCLALGYPLAYAIANGRTPWSTVAMLLVLVPFWMSLIVRSTSWIVMLQRQGLVNDALVAMGAIADDQRFTMIHNMVGTVVAMTHVLLPFLVLPLYAVMRTIPPLHRQAAASLGAGPWQTFAHVYWPQTLPGIGAGALLVFMLAIGYYIAPALVGGRTGQFISNVIAYHMQYSLNWGLAAALNFVLLACVVAIFAVFHRLVGVERIRFG